MPEHGVRQEEALPGSVTEGPSTDAFIEERLKGLLREIEGISGQVIETVGADPSGVDVLPPKTIVTTGGLVSTHPSGDNVIPFPQKSPTDSVSGLSVRRKREVMRRAA